MATKRPVLPPTICRNCGDEMVIVAHYLPTGPLCADCAPVEGSGELVELNAPACPDTPKNDMRSAPPATENSGEPAAADAGDRGAFSPAPPLDHRAFAPPADAAHFAIEVEEWIFATTAEDALPLATPREASPASRSTAAMLYAQGVPLFVKFVVVLEWTLWGGPTFEARTRGMLVGPSFPCIGLEPATDRQRALAAAKAFAQGEARRLKAAGPYGYRPAKSLEAPCAH